MKVKDLVPSRIKKHLIELRNQCQSGFTTYKLAIHKLSVFFPNSGNYYRYPDLTFNSANSFPEKLNNLIDICSRKNIIIEKNTNTDFKEIDIAKELGDLFSKYGSDKSTTHDYHVVYADIILRLDRNAPLKILEIGMGTNKSDLVSTMGTAGKPGASLRSFRDFLPQATIYGADVDEDILFTEDRIITARVDQLNPSSFKSMTNSLNENKFDVIIDDGLHSVDANLNTLIFALDSLRPKGWIVIEDIPPRTKVVWELVNRLLSNETRECQLISCKSNYVFVVKKLD